ncbi:HAD family hydrolase [Aliishimia ponticola]|uniref:phosphoglycolate phosphatase n=1 Tax=Aliishimia ponticola TaxID=2499833 RepID=A0A4V3XK61_9RHOB|nr:HAD family hydrolase [Aliishimia ponticola]THH35723.1 HAD family hydrolase [Aliishimia ponticola]
MTSSDFAGILFDKDGTLLDFSRTWDAWAKAFLTRLADNADHARELGDAVGYDLAAGRFAPHSVVIAGTPMEVARALERHLPGKSLPQIVNLMNEEAARAPQVEAVPLRPLLEHLRDRGLRLGVATNDAEAPAHAHLRAAGVAEIFDFIAGFDSGYGGKPAPGQLLAFADAMGLAPDRCIMVGDSRHDLLAGRAAGFTTVGVLTGYAVAEDLADLADAVLPDIGHMPDWLTTRNEAPTPR